MLSQIKYKKHTINFFFFFNYEHDSDFGIQDGGLLRYFENLFLLFFFQNRRGVAGCRGLL